MAIKFKGVSQKGEIIGDILPEYVPASLEEDLKIEREINSVNDGYNKSRTMRKVGSIDQAVLYNYAMMKGVPPEKHSEYWAADNSKNIIAFLEEFPMFKVVDKPL